MEISTAPDVELKKLRAQNIFVKAFLSQDDWEKEKKLLDYRFKLAQKLNVNGSEIKIRSWALFVENQLVDITLSVEETCQKIGHQTSSRSRLEEKQVLKIGLLNCRSISTIDRRMNLDILLKEYNIDILCLTETWLTDEVRNSEIFLNRQYFVQSRKNRKVGTHGGTLCSQNKSLFQSSSRN